MNKKNRNNLSSLGESKAQSLLIAKGYRILQCNFFSAYGEIDIICLHEETVIFCEVKTRTSLENDFDVALRAVSKNKQNKIKKTALYYLSTHQKFENYFTRFDVIAVLHNPHKKEFQTYHLEEAFY